MIYERLVALGHQFRVQMYHGAAGVQQGWRRFTSVLQGTKFAYRSMKLRSALGIHTTSVVFQKYR